MKLQRTTLALVMLALAMGGAVYLYETQAKPRQEEAEATEKNIFDFEEKDVVYLTIEKDNQVLEFEKTGESPNAWEMQQPEKIPASDAAVVFLLNLLAKDKYRSAFTINSQEELQEYGLDKPLATVTVRLANNETHKIILGSPSFDGQFIYAQTDLSLQNQEVLLVPINFQYAVEREMEEWKQLEE